jgi:mutual gliding-motility protein MglA
MALIHWDTQEIHCKLVYYGPACAGKTENLVFIHKHLPVDSCSELWSVREASKYLLFFDFQHPIYQRIDGFTVRFHLYTVPGSTLYESTKRAVLHKADALVFVANSGRDRMAENISSLKEVVLELQYHQRTLVQVPLILQYNKRDYPVRFSLEELDHYLNPLGWAHVAAIATEGIGVMETLDALCAQVIRSLQPPQKRYDPLPPHNHGVPLQITCEPLTADMPRYRSTTQIEPVQAVFIGP